MSNNFFFFKLMIVEKSFIYNDKFRVLIDYWKKVFDFLNNNLIIYEFLSDYYIWSNICEND